MENELELQSLSDDELLRRLSDVLAQSRRVEWMLVAHIAEVDARKLFAREGSPSMFQYCLDALHLSESEAYRRIAAARVSRLYPVILTMLEDGRLHLAGISVLKKHLTEANYEEVLARATHKTKKQIEELVAEIAPKPDVPPSIRKRPQPKANAVVKAPASPDELRLGTVEPDEKLDPAKTNTPADESKAPAASRAKPATVEPLAPVRFKVEFTASAEFRDKLKRLEALMAGKDLAGALEVAVTEKLERLEAKRFGKSKKPRKSLEDADTSPGVRGISAPVRRFVYARDGNQCVFLSPDGRRCPERHNLEFHHMKPYARDGDRSSENLCLLCPAHNAYMAEMDYGKEKMNQYRRSADRVREPSPSFERLLPDRAIAAPLVRAATYPTIIPLVGSAASTGP